MAAKRLRETGRAPDIARDAARVRRPLSQYYCVTL
jgi:hypothetical protein